MRNLVEVIDKMISVIPSSEKGIINALKSNRSSALYSSPETMRLRWEVTQYTIDNCIGTIDNRNGLQSLNEWEQKVIDIWMDKK